MELTETDKGRVMPMAVAGRFYDDQSDRLAAQMDGWLLAAPPATSVDFPRAMILSHAGYVFSGALQAKGYQCWLNAWQQAMKTPYKTWVVLGPSHHLRFTGVATTSATAVATPLGELALDETLNQAMMAQFDWVRPLPQAHAKEHSLEVNFPFIQRLNQMVPEADMQVVPLVVGHIEAEQLSDLVVWLWQQPQVAFVLSSDLSHFLTDEQARKTDEMTAQWIENGQWQRLTSSQACGFQVIQGFTAAMHRLTLGTRFQRLALQNSSAVPAGQAHKDRVVGYGVWVWSENQADKTVPWHGAVLDAADFRLGLQLVKAAICAGWQQKPLTLPRPVLEQSTGLRRQGACFVTLNRHGQLRGCIGSLQAHQPLINDIVSNGIKASRQDPRFPPLTAEETDGLSVEISVLTPQQSIGHFATMEEAMDNIRPQVDGVTLVLGQHRGTFLPSVWASLPQPQTFMSQLLRKAQLPAWDEGIEVFVYQAQKASASWEKIETLVY